MTISILANDVALPGFESEHGFAALVERNGERVLFDTGPSPLLLENARRLGLDLRGLQAIVLSHGHYDHTGGLEAVLENVGPHVPVIGVAGVDRARYGVKHGVGSREIGWRGGHEARARLHTIRGQFAVAPGIHATGPITRRFWIEDTGGPFYLDPEGIEPDPLTDDQALVIDSDDGPIVLLGCAHSGVINALTAVSQRMKDRHFAAVLGGMHLNAASEGRVQWTLARLAEYDIERLGPCHCTGEQAIERLGRQSGDRQLECLAGSRLRIGVG